MWYIRSPKPIKFSFSLVTDLVALKSSRAAINSYVISSYDHVSCESTR